MAIKIEFNKEVCIGCGTCAAVCPDNWVMDGDKAKPLKTELKEVGCNKEAADACPVQAIRIAKK